jgi:hypothetical protein
MSARRQSPRRSRDVPAEEQQQAEEMKLSVPDDDDGDDDEAPEEAPASSSSKAGKETRLASREQRRKRRDGLRSKSVGVVVGKIDTKSKSSNKILFGDDFVADEGTAVSKKQQDDAEESDDDDDQVEEVKASVAKEQALVRRQQERTTATELQKLVTSKQRKRKAAVVEDEPAMDEDFFAQLDVDLDEERKEKKRKTAAAPKGKHTTFVSKDENDDAIQADHNIEVVVLAESSSITANTASGSGGPSEAAMLFSRSRLDDGICTIKKSGGATKTKPLKTQGWKRSNKMNRILLTKNRKNKPASHFVIKA